MSPPRFARRHRSGLRFPIPPQPTSDAATVSFMAVLVRHSPNPIACRPSSIVADDGTPSSDLPVGRSGRPPGPTDRPPGSIPPGAASPRPAPRSPLRGLRPSGDDPCRLRSLTLAARFACRCRRKDPVLPLPLLGRSAPIAGSSPRRLAEAHRGSPLRSVAARTLLAALRRLTSHHGVATGSAIARHRHCSDSSDYRPVPVSERAHRSSSDIALSRPALRALALRTGPGLLPKPRHSPRTSPSCGPAARPCR